MTRQIPGYLRVHNAAPADPPPSGRPDSLSRFWRRFAEATGWRIERMPRRGPLPPLVPNDETAHSDGTAPAPPEATMRLARSARHLIARLRKSEAALRRQEAELAVACGVTVRPEAQRRMADRLGSILRDGAAILGGCAGGLYLLDESTSTLKLRAAHGLPPERLAAPARPLRGALADLEALVSGVVGMENLAEPPDWKSPERFASGLCASVATPHMPIGTVWFWGDRQARYGRRSRAAAAMIADRIAAELERELLARKATGEHRLRRALRTGADWQQHQAPHEGVLVRGWDVAGWAEEDPAVALAGGWLVWDILSTGELAAGIGHAEGGSLGAALQASSARGAWLALSPLRHTPDQLIRRVSDALWDSSTSGHELSMAYAHVDHETGETRMSVAGEIETLVVNRHGFRPLGVGSPRIGTAPDLCPGSFTTRLLPGDVLLAANRSAVTDDAHAAPGRLTQRVLADVVRDHVDQPASAILAAVRRALAESGATRLARTALVLRREPTA